MNLQNFHFWDHWELSWVGLQLHSGLKEHTFQTGFTCMAWTFRRGAGSGEDLHRSSHWHRRFLRRRQHRSERRWYSFQKESVCSVFVCSAFSSCSTSLHLTHTHRPRDLYAFNQDVFSIGINDSDVAKKKRKKSDLQIVFLDYKLPFSPFFIVWLVLRLIFRCDFMKYVNLHWPTKE